MGRIGLPELLIMLALLLLIYGPRKLGELGKGLGEGIRGFKKSVTNENDLAEKDRANNKAP